jgi:hypothetical protein
MTGRAATLSVLAGLGVLAAVVAGVLAFRGGDASVVRGVALGAGLGAAGIALEAGLLVRALALPRNQALTIVTVGFTIRLAVLACGALLLKGSGFADPYAFAMTFVGGFFAGIPLGAAATTGHKRPSGAVNP